MNHKHNPHIRSIHSLKTSLDQFYRQYNFRERMQHDPIQFPHRYTTPEDREVSGFIASCFAYGRVEIFIPVIENILRPCGRHPARFFKNFTLQKDKKYFKNINYRFNREKDVLCLLFMISHVLKKWGSLRDLFKACYLSHQEDIEKSLEHFAEYFLAINTSPVYGNNRKPSGLTHFFPSPKTGSACKRMNLFLRWMVRTKDVDFGIWNGISPSRLIIPLDTHIEKISKCIGITKRASLDWKMASEITESFKKLDPEDPVKYDFALCHHGISGSCRGVKSHHTCLSCLMYPIRSLH